MLPTGSISYLYYADRLAQLPLGVIGIAIGTALLPMMSKSIASNDVDHSRNLFQNALLYGFLFSVPASFALIVMSYPVMYTLFVHGEFSLIDGYVAAQVLTAYAVGMPAYIASKTYSTVFYAHQDTKTPLIIASISACCNIVLSLSLINFYGVWGIALATALAGWIQLILLYWRACKKDVCQFSKPIGVRLIKVVFASFFMAISVHLISDNVFEWVELNVLTRIVYLSVAVLSGLIIYSGLIMLLKVVALHDLKLIFGRKKHDHLSH